MQKWIKKFLNPRKYSYKNCTCGKSEKCTVKYYTTSHGGMGIESGFDECGKILNDIENCNKYMKYSARKDANQDEIVKALRAVGVSVAITHQLGNGFPDISVGWKGDTYLFEIKDGDKPPSKQKLTPDEVKWHDEWKGSVHIVRSVTEAFEILGIKQ